VTRRYRFQCMRLERPADRKTTTREDEENKGKTYSSLRSFGVMIGYLGFKLPPAYIFPRISSERVSWLSRSKSKSEIGPEHERDGHEHRMDAIDFGKVERKGWDGKRGLTSGTS
jgi:hypothetical protein